MNDKSKALLKKMCFILEIIRGTCLISVVLLIGLSLFYAFNKDVYNTLFGSIRIDYLQLIFNDDLALNKDKMSMWLPLIFLIKAIFVFIIYKCVCQMYTGTSLYRYHNKFLYHLSLVFFVFTFEFSIVCIHQVFE